MRQLTMFQESTLHLPTSPSCIVASLSFGKDSFGALLEIIEKYPHTLLIAHHQRVLEDWPGSVEYGQEVCKMLGIPLYISQGHYHGLRCNKCSNQFLSASLPKAYCHQCSSKSFTFLRMVESIYDLVEWRRMWPSNGVRFCTSYFKRDVFNAWARANTALLGETPVLVMGERWLESASRAKLPEVSYRSGLRQGWMLEYHPILAFRRIDSFRKLRQYGIEPHYCYKAQWRELLLNQHRRWQEEGIEPHTSYPGQWDGIQYWELSDDILNPMIDRLMYEVDEEHGPRCSCVACFYVQAEGIAASYQVPQGKAIIDRGIEIEQATGHTIHHHESLNDMIVAK